MLRARVPGIAALVFAACGGPSTPPADGLAPPSAVASGLGTSAGAASSAQAPPASSAFAPAPVAARSVALGGANLCVLGVDGAVRCVGEWPLLFETPTSVGQKNQYLHEPVTVAGLGEVKELAVTVHRGCAVLAAGSVACWGNTQASANGWSGGVAGRLDAVAVEGVGGAVGLALTFTESCALGADGAITCWGQSSVITRSTRGPAPPPRRVELGGAVQISGAMNHVCAVTRAGKVACWGENRQGELDGHATLAAEAGKVVTVPGLADVVEVGTSWHHNCARTRGGEVWCWGQNATAQLGDGTSDARSAPGRVAGLAPAAALAMPDTGSWSCALEQGGALACWGQEMNCNLGAPRTGCEKRVMQSTMGTSEAEHCPRPQRIALALTPAGISAGSSTACAWDAAGAVACWGRSLTGGASMCTPEPLRF